MANSIKLFMPDGMIHSPFSHPRWMAAMNAIAVETPEEADFAVFRVAECLPAILSCGVKNILEWSYEPYQSSESRVWFETDGNRAGVHVFNVHNGMIYTDNFLYANTPHVMPLLEKETDCNVSFSDKTISVAATYRPDLPLFVGGIDRSLNALRSRQALELHERGQARIIGRNWPRGVALEDTRETDRHKTKRSFLMSSNFNLCFENCLADYYVTEKIWDAIASGSLPVYYANGTIYQTFPRDSFIDASVYGTTEQLLQLTAGMEFEEYRERVNLCRKVYNHTKDNGLRMLSWSRTVGRIKTFLESYANEAALSVP